ncbi:phage portal protein, partial [Streptococcus pneumoniae]|nr:phage portal protein [Streptococcus pneumoniae]
VLHVEYEPVTDYISNLRPFPMREVSFQTDKDSYVISFRGEEYSPDEVVHFVINPDPDIPYIGTGFRVTLTDVVQSLNMATKTK